MRSCAKTATVPRCPYAPLHGVRYVVQNITRADRREKSCPDSGKYCKRLESCQHIHAAQVLAQCGCKVAVVSRACDGREPVIRLSLNMTWIHTNLSVGGASIDAQQTGCTATIRMRR